MSMHFWLTWITTFFVIIVALIIGDAVNEYWRWKRGNQ